MAKNVKSSYVPSAGDFFTAKMGYFDICHSLELDEVESVIRERSIAGICISFSPDPCFKGRWVLRYMSTTQGDDEGDLKQIDIDFFDFVEFEKIS